MLGESLPSPLGTRGAVCPQDPPAGGDLTRPGPPRGRRSLGAPQTREENMWSAGALGRLTVPGLGRWPRGRVGMGTGPPTPAALCQLGLSCPAVPWAGGVATPTSPGCCGSSRATTRGGRSAQRCGSRAGVGRDEGSWSCPRGSGFVSVSK